MRAVVSARRAALGDEARGAADLARTALALAAVEQLVGSVAVYVSRPPEPDTRALIDALVTSGRRVLLPVLTRGRARPEWAWFEGWDATATVWGGIPQPTGAALGPEALAEVDLVLAPALGVGLDGSRLGTGGGWYDRALLHRRDGVPVWVLGSESELVPTVPREPHDVTVDAVITESRFLALPAS